MLPIPMPLRALPALLAALLLSIVSATRLQASDKGRYFLESLGGTERYATIETGGKIHKAIEGMELHPGDRVRTGYRTSAKIVYPDGTKVIVGRLSDITIGGKNGDQEVDDVGSGEVRAVVAKPPGGSEKKIKFVIRTKSAVLGVRGTDFLLRNDIQKARAEEYTLDGRVDISRSEAELRAGKATTVEMNHMAVITPAQITVKPFEPRPFISSVAGDNPELLKQARSDAEFREDYVAPVSSGMKWFDFQANYLYVTQKSGANLSTGELSWNPEYHLNPRFALQGDAGVFLLKSNANGGSTASNFAGLEFAALLGININTQLRVDLGGGLETWVGQGATGLVVMGDVAWMLHGWGWLDRVFVGVSDFLNSPDGQADGGHQYALHIKAGVGVSF
jgi:hypothetical protein